MQFLQQIALRTVLACGMLGLMTLSAQAQSTTTASSDASVLQILTPKTDLVITELYSRYLEFANKIARVDGFDPEVIEVSAESRYQLRVLALAPGVTKIVATDEHDQVYEIDIFVEGDVRHLKAHIGRLFPDAAVDVVKIEDAVVLRGVVSDPDQITQIVEVAEQFYPNVLNHLRFGSSNQVTLSCKIIEAQRTKIRRMGFNWDFVGQNAAFASTPGDLLQHSASSTPFGGPAGLTALSNAMTDSQLFGFLVLDDLVFSGYLEALRQESLLKILAEPEVTVDSGRPANLLSGGEFPILVPQALGTVTIEWRQFGVSLEAVPIVLGNGNLRLEVRPEVSERDFSNAVQVQGFTVPGITTRRANTQVRMKFGQTLMVGGLVSSRQTAETHKIPFLGELPWVGTAFRRVRYDENETELIILVKPELVAPLDACEVPEGGPGMFTEAPTDKELFFRGMIEVPNYQGLRQQVPAQLGPGRTQLVPRPPYTPETLIPQVPVTPVPEADWHEQLEPVPGTPEPATIPQGDPQASHALPPAAAEASKVAEESAEVPELRGPKLQQLDLPKMTPQEEIPADSISSRTWKILPIKQLNYRKPQAQTYTPPQTTRP